MTKSHTITSSYTLLVFSFFLRIWLIVFLFDSNLSIRVVAFIHGFYSASSRFRLHRKLSSGLFFAALCDAQFRQSVCVLHYSLFFFFIQMQFMLPINASSVRKIIDFVCQSAVTCWRRAHSSIEWKYFIKFSFFCFRFLLFIFFFYFFAFIMGQYFECMNLFPSVFYFVTAWFQWNWRRSIK